MKKKYQTVATSDHGCS